MPWHHHWLRGFRRASERQIGKNRKKGRAISLESLERRDLLSFSAHINFQPTAKTPPAGYLADTGQIFGDRGNGLQYGWNTQNLFVADRWTTADDLHDTNAAMQWQGNFTWELAIPNGSYAVHTTAGDANSWNDLQKINAEGVTVVNGTTTSSARWLDGTANVTVTDGRLTVSSPSALSRNAIDFIDITPADGNVTPPPTNPPDITPPPVNPPVVQPPVTPPVVLPPVTPPTGAFSAKINFQPAGLPAVAGYVADNGKTYSDRGNGLRFGWNAADITLADRWTSADDLHDRLAAMQWGGNYSWEIALPNGTYQVHILAGDANSWNAPMNITAEGQSAIKGTTTSGNRWLEGTLSVTVNDGKLTIANGAGATANVINYIEITSTTDGTTTTGGTTTTPPPTDPPPVTQPPVTPPPVTQPPVTQPGGAIVGTNIDGLADWATVSPFDDITTEFRQWGSLAQDYTPDPTLPLTADNYPLTDAGAISYLHGYPDGNYKVSYDGVGNLSFFGMNAKYTLLSHTGDHWEGVLSITPHSSAGSILDMRITGINSADPVQNLHILSPDSDPAASDTFRPVFLQKLMAFNGPLRVMDWMQTNNTPAANWQDRDLTTRFSFTNDKGVPYEDIIKLANTLKKDVWINVPYHATADYITQMAKLFRDALDPSLHVYVEFSNEVWNPTFEQMRSNQAAAAADPALTRTDDFGRQAQLYGKLAGRAAQIFQQAYGANRYANTVRFEIGGLIANTYWAQTALQQIQTNYGDPKNLFYGVAVAPYVGVQGDMDSIDNSSLTMQGLFDWMNNWVNGPLTTWIRQHKSLTDAYGLHLDSYEAGQSLSYLNSQNVDLKIAAQDDPRMGDFYKHLITVWTKKSNGGVFGNFALATQYGPYGFWGVLQSIDQATSVKYTAVTSMAGKAV